MILVGSWIHLSFPGNERLLAPVHPAVPPENSLSPTDPLISPGSNKFILSVVKSFEFRKNPDAGVGGSVGDKQLFSPGPNATPGNSLDILSLWTYGK
jgi:hypothetical protein